MNISGCGGWVVASPASLVGPGIVKFLPDRKSKLESYFIHFIRFALVQHFVDRGNSYKIFIVLSATPKPQDPYRIVCLIIN